jgi:hypothetical protein
MEYASGKAFAKEKVKSLVSMRERGRRRQDKGFEGRGLTVCVASDAQA